MAQRYNELLALWNTNDSAELALSSNYSTGLAGLPMTTPYQALEVYHVYHQYATRAPQRDALAAHLKERDIGTMIYYPVPLHLQGLYAGLGYGEGSPSTTLRQGSGDVLSLSKGQGSERCLPMSEAASREVLSLPMYPELTEAQQISITGAIKEFYGR